MKAPELAQIEKTEPLSSTNCTNFTFSLKREIFILNYLLLSKKEAKHRYFRNASG